MRSLGTGLCALALALLLHRVAAEEQPGPLYECMNGGFQQQLTTFEDFAKQKPARLRLEKALWSSKKRSVGLTVVTGLNTNRFNQLEAQCRSYNGPISAAVYVPLHNPKKESKLSKENQQTLEKAVLSASRLHARMELAGEDACQLDVMVLYETLADDIMRVMFPINTLRNYGLLQARTPLVAMVDVDLLLSSNLVAWLQAGRNYEKLKDLASRDVVLVLPAFETAPNNNETKAHNLADAAARMNKTQLHRLVEKNLVYQFAKYLYLKGHTPTNYNHWFASDKPYPINYSAGYEPWFIIDRIRNPFYDSSFRGYGWNKVAHVLNIYGAKYKFVVHPAGFLVHRQHSRSSADKMYQTQKKDYEKEVQKKVKQIAQNLAGLTHKFRDQVQTQLAAGTYNALVDEGVTRCVKSLPWWAKHKQQPKPQ